MDAVMDTPAVAQVDAPRRRDDVLPEHEERWPTTLEVQDVIAERYDGTAATAHEIGLELVTVKHGCYPGWRVEQIAQGMGIARAKREEIIERVRAEETAAGQFFNNSRPTNKPVRGIEEAIAVVNNGPATPTRQMLREDLAAIKAAPRCRECGATFEAWRWGQGWSKVCHPCAQAKWSAAHQKKAATPPVAPEPAWPEPVAESVSLPWCGVCGQTFAPWRGGGMDERICEPCHIHNTPAPAPEPEAAPVTDADETLIEMTFAPVASPATESAVLDIPLDEDDDCELTFDDLPGNRIVFELLDQLPTNGRWSGRRRYRWLTAFTSVLDLLIDDDRDDETREAESEVWER